MSNLGGLHTVPAMIALACVLAGAAVAATACALILDDITDIASLTSKAVAFVCGIAAFACLFTAAGLQQEHYNETCHARGGVLDPGGDHGCVKPGSFISVH